MGRGLDHCHWSGVPIGIPSLVNGGVRMTLTVIASEPETGTIGLATMTCLVGVGDVVPAGRLNVGLIACQAHIERPHVR